MLAALLALSMAVPTNQAAVVPKSGLQISKSSRIKPGSYRLISKSEEIKDAAIVIRGNNLVVDFRGVILEGSAQTIEPDQRVGLGVYVEGKNVTIKNARIHGYKVALMAKNSPGLRILDSDFSYNWKQHLNSTPDQEDGGDWMSYHQNEKDEWLRYGAAMYLSDCKSFEVKGCRVNGGQNALMMTSCDDGKVWNNDFSFNSSLGIGMYRSSNNKIMHNKIDWCVRGFSYGKYNRGQDSAGILVYEQSNKNIFAYNSVTHGGDGFFLWAGQTTMDTGKGGCNDNLLYGNDFSHAPTNGIEATFSRNVFANNLIMECWHGIWGGYSYESKVVGNKFAYNAEAIAWEHGQDNLIASNLFKRNNEDLVIWSNASQDPNWGYPKNRDTRSRTWMVIENVFLNAYVNTFRLSRTDEIQIERNLIDDPGKVFQLNDPIPTHLKLSNNDMELRSAEPLVNGPFKVIDSKTPKFPPASSLNQGESTDKAEYLKRFKSFPWTLEIASQRISPTSYDSSQAAWTEFRVAPMPGGIDPFLAPNTLRGWRYMFVDEWGPYDFKRPMIVYRGETGRNIHRFEVLGPAGEWRIVTLNGATVNKQPSGISLSRKIGRTSKEELTITLPQGGIENINLVAEFVGAEVTDHRGIVHPKGKPFQFKFVRSNIPINWNIAWHAYDRAKIEDPKAKMPDPLEVLGTEITKPIATQKTSRLDFATGGSPFKDVPDNGFITLANGEFEVKPGQYELSVLADDGVRLWLDGKLLIDEWHWQGPTRYDKTVKLGGKHKLRVYHYEIDGYTALKVEVAPKR